MLSVRRARRRRLRASSISCRGRPPAGWPGRDDRSRLKSARNNLRDDGRWGSHIQSPVRTLRGSCQGTHAGKTPKSAPSVTIRSRLPSRLRSLAAMLEGWVPPRPWRTGAPRVAMAHGIVACGSATPGTPIITATTSEAPPPIGEHEERRLRLARGSISAALRAGGNVLKGWSQQLDFICEDPGLSRRPASSAGR